MNSNEQHGSAGGRRRRIRIRTAGVPAVAGVTLLALVATSGSGTTVAGPVPSETVGLSGAAVETASGARAAASSVGTRGPRGPRGYRGYRGYRGDTGPTGATGAKGDPGPTGPQGPSGVVGTFHFNSSWGPATIPGNNGLTILKPAVCTTGSHVAGSGETAVISMGATASPNPSANDTLYIDAMYRMDGGAVQTIDSVGLSAESMSDGIANVSTFTTMELQAGHTYEFRTGVSSNAQVQVPSNGGYCQGTVMIVRSGG